VLVLERGAKRHGLRADAACADLVVTNYALQRRDIAEWKETELLAAILDEAQQIKNPDAEVARAARLLRARHHLALTGTPLENRPLDLWSLMDFANPGYLGVRRAFESRYDRPEAPPERRRLLAAKLRPVLLRRLKQEVAPELPERIEERRECALRAGQRKLYLAELRRSRRLIDALDSDASCRDAESRATSSRAQRRDASASLPSSRRTRAPASSSSRFAPEERGSTSRPRATWSSSIPGGTPPSRRRPLTARTGSDRTVR
jgi:SNF2 family DNA or RNA helicase